MLRDIIGWAFIIVSVLKIWLAFAQVYSHRIKFARWFGWPPEMEWKIAWLFISMAKFLFAVGVFFLITDGPIEWWFVGVSLNITVAHFVLAWGFIRIPPLQLRFFSKRDINP